MPRLALFILALIAFLLVLIYSRPMDQQVSDLCEGAIEARGLEVRGAATVEINDGFWDVYGESGGQRWVCSVQVVGGVVPRLDAVDLLPAE